MKNTSCTRYSGSTMSHEQYMRLREEYYRKYAELESLKEQLDIAQLQMQKDCEHEWEADDSRGGRSRHSCTKCQKPR